MKCLLFIILHEYFELKTVNFFCSKKKNRSIFLQYLSGAVFFSQTKRSQFINRLNWNFTCLSTDVLHTLKDVSLWTFKLANLYARSGRTWIMFEDDGGWRLSWRCLACKLSPFPLGSALHRRVLILLSAPSMPTVVAKLPHPSTPRLSSTHNCPRRHIAGAREGTRGHETSYAHSYSRKRERENAMRWTG